MVSLSPPLLCRKADGSHRHLQPAASRALPFPCVQAERLLGKGIAAAAPSMAGTREAPFLPSVLEYMKLVSVSWY